MRSHKITIAAASAGLAFAVATVGLAATGDDSGSTQSPKDAQNAQPASASVTDGVRREFPVFATEKIDQDAPDLVGRAGVRIRVGTLSGDRTVWASADGDRLCIYYVPKGAVGPGGGCDSVEAGREYGVFTSTEYTDGVDFAGLVPAGVDTVTLEMADAPAIRLPVKGNAVTRNLDRRPSALILTRSGKDKRIPLGG